jgi:hypothetical protein
MKAAPGPSIPHSRALLISDRAYRKLLAAYPIKFRQRFGPEMAQVFRTCCRTAYNTAGAGGVVRLWLPTLWDWAWSAAGERFSSLFGRSKVYKVHTWRASSQLIPILFFLSACLILLFVNPCSWLFGEPLFGEHCWLEVNNLSGKTLFVTPIDVDHPFSPVRLYRTTDPVFPAYQQRNIPVKPGDQVTLSYSCELSVPVLYACDLEGDCYIHQHAQYIYEGSQMFTFKSLESLTRPDAALEAAVQSFPEHNYSSLRYVLLCFIQLIALIGGFFWLVRSRTVEIPKSDI